MQGAATAFSLWLCLHYKVARAYGVLLSEKSIFGLHPIDFKSVRKGF